MYKLPVYYNKLHAHQRREVREQYIKQQNNLCYWCKGSLDRPPPQHIQKKSINLALFPTNFLQHPIHLQHDHKTGLTEGAVHARCNAVMWQYHGK